MPSAYVNGLRVALDLAQQSASEGPAVQVLVLAHPAASPLAALLVALASPPWGVHLVPTADAVVVIGYGGGQPPRELRRDVVTYPTTRLTPPEQLDIILGGDYRATLRAAALAMAGFLQGARTASSHQEQASR